MTFNKSVLAMAVAVAISAPVFAVDTNAGNIDLTGTGQVIIGGAGAQNINVAPSATADLFADQRPSDSNKGQHSSNALYFSKNSSLIEIKDANLDSMDFDLRDANSSDQKEEFLTEGKKSTFLINNVVAKQAFIETNGAHIGQDGDAAAIEIKNSNLTGYEFDIEPGDDPIPEIFVGHKELIVNNGGSIVTDNTDNLPDSYPTGGNAIDISSSTIDGLIINEDNWSNTENIQKSAEILSMTGSAISVRDSKWRGGVVNDNSLIEGNIAGIELINTDFDGAIINEDNGVISGSYGIALFTSGEKNTKYTGNIENSASIVGGRVGIGLSGNTAFNGTINNEGLIFGGSEGIHIADSVTGNITVNQRAGELSGSDTALRMNKVTRTNYTGGQINGNVENNGGTFYVEGNRTIAGDYVQTSGSTLAMGLHKETSLTANNFNLAEGSKVLIDLSRGDLYVQNGTKVELLKGNVTDTGVNYAVNSNLVKVATTERNVAGNLVLTFDRTSFTQLVADAIKTGKFNGLQANNVASMATVLQKLDTLAQTNPAIAKLLNSLDGSPESFTSLLPDVSGASVAGAMSAVSQSGSLVSVRATSLASGDMLDNGGMWVQGLVSKGDQDNRNGEAYDVKSNGFVLGADTKLDTGLVVGAAYSFINTDSTTQNSNTDSDYHMATAYASQAINQILLDGQAYYAWGDNDGRRNIGTTSNYDSSLYGARVGAGYQYDVAPATHLIPTLSLEASRLSVDGYTETGSIAALQIDSQNFNRLELGLNTELSKDYQLRNAMLTPSVNVGVFHDFEGKAQNSTVAFAAAPAETFKVTGSKPEKTRYVTGVGLDIVSNELLTVSAEYNYNWNNDGFDANSGALKFRWDF
ncbi:autotransporter domain-containing protein [Oceanisphaera sp. IT1-181]|uniref:autotransporter family protein n=1 Tax=Oceanisphaera sp. IT1-181 TaxID=3081199 RepID=UPI0029C9F35C|nr:autotransporter domain-containing protein [Oceanisphaera sp. IT1-181]